MSATETLVLPPRSHNQPEIIDVDAFDDDGTNDVVFTGFSRPTLSSMGSSTLNSEGLAYMGFNNARSTARRSRSNGGAQAGPSRSTRISEDIIILSDDEGESSSSSAPGSSRGRLFSPPPPPPLRGLTPSVPPLPRHLLSQASLPIRRRQPPSATPQEPPPVIRPIEQPLPFEARMSSLPRLPPRNSLSPALGPAPRSHHQPAMGFGGALIALNRQHAMEEANRQDRAARNSFNLPSFSDIFRRMTSYRNDSRAGSSDANSASRPWQRLWPFQFGGDAELDENPHFSPFSDDDMWFNLPDAIAFDRRKVAEKVVHYKPEYTHPDKAGPGFTVDFSPADSTSGGASSSAIVLDDDDAGPSHAASSSGAASAVETTLVCARCLDPLVLAAPEGASEEEQKRCRVWALRCGHMLDGKCVMEFITPPPPPAPEEEMLAEPEYTGKGKGKARAELEAPAVEPAADVFTLPSSADRKGKRKAVEPLEPESPPKRAAVVEPAPQETSIRSRLRSHTRAAADAPSPAGDSAAQGTESPQLSMSRSRTRMVPRRRRLEALAYDLEMGNISSLPSGRGGKGKGKARAKGEPKLAIEAEHEWRCPIAGCGRVHYSVRVEGAWRNDEGRGGIALFV